MTYGRRIANLDRTTPDMYTGGRIRAESAAQNGGFSDVTIAAGCRGGAVGVGAATLPLGGRVGAAAVIRRMAETSYRCVPNWYSGGIRL